MIGRKLVAGVEAGLLRNLHVVLAERGGETILESYGSGPDEDWGRPLGDVSFGPETLHDLRSITKSVVSLLYGIALERDLVPRLDTPILSAFPGYPDLAADPARMSRTIEHAFTMSLGMDWDETKPYTDPENSEIAMELAPDRYRFILDRALVAEPGTRWIYSGGATALIGKIIETGTGKTLPEFAKEVLFDPLGIKTFKWSAGKDGTHSSASGVRLTAPDLLKIGRLVLNDGVWEGRQVVPEAWLTASLRPVIATGRASTTAISGSVEARTYPHWAVRCPGSVGLAMAGNGFLSVRKPTSPPLSIPATTTTGSPGSHQPGYGSRSSWPIFSGLELERIDES